MNGHAVTVLSGRGWIFVVALIVTVIADALLAIYNWWPWYMVPVLAILLLVMELQNYILPERIVRLSPRMKRIGLGAADAILVEMVLLAVLYWACPSGTATTSGSDSLSE